MVFGDAGEDKKEEMPRDTVFVFVCITGRGEGARQGWALSRGERSDRVPGLQDRGQERRNREAAPVIPQLGGGGGPAAQSQERVM